MYPLCAGPSLSGAVHQQEQGSAQREGMARLLRFAPGGLQGAPAIGQGEAFFQEVSVFLARRKRTVEGMYRHFVKNVYGRKYEFFVKTMRKCIKRMHFLFLFLMFCINILHEYVNGRSYLGLKFVKNVHGITKGAEGKT